MMKHSIRHLVWASSTARKHWRGQVKQQQSSARRTAVLRASVPRRSLLGTHVVLRSSRGLHTVQSPVHTGPLQKFQRRLARVPNFSSWEICLYIQYAYIYECASFWVNLDSSWGLDFRARQKRPRGAPRAPKEVPGAAQEAPSPQRQPEPPPEGLQRASRGPPEASRGLPEGLSLIHI